MKARHLVCNEVAAFILSVIANNVFCLGKLIDSKLNKFNSSTYSSIRFLRSRGLLGNVRNSVKGNCNSYFITYRGRAFLYACGDVSQEKYLTIQSS